MSFLEDFIISSQALSQYFFNFVVQLRDLLRARLCTYVGVCVPSLNDVKICKTLQQQNISSLHYYARLLPNLEEEDTAIIHLNSSIWWRQKNKYTISVCVNITANEFTKDGFFLSENNTKCILQKIKLRQWILKMILGPMINRKTWIVFLPCGRIWRGIILKKITKVRRHLINFFIRVLIFYFELPSCGP